MIITANNSEYTMLIGYQREHTFRNAFNALSEKIFELSFQDWYRAGYWNDKYIPYTLFDGKKAIANVSVNIMDFITFGNKQRYIQIGTVMTDEDYRNKGLSRFLMDKVLDDWHDKCDFIYLYANNSVLNFYPKFNFEIMHEFECFKPIVKKYHNHRAKKLDMNQQFDRDMLHEYAKHTKIFSKIAMHENADLVMFYCTSLLKDNVFYIESLDVITVATFNNQQLLLWDFFGKAEVELDNIIYHLADSNIVEVLLGFVPLDCNSYQIREIKGKDTLFIQKNQTKLFDENKVMFPLLSHA